MKSIRTSLMLIISCLIFGVCAIFFTVTYLFSSKTMYDIIFSDMITIAGASAQQISDALDTEFSVLESLANRPDIRSRSTSFEQKAALLASDVKKERGHRLYAAVDAQGNAFLSTTASATYCATLSQKLK